MAASPLSTATTSRAGRLAPWIAAAAASLASALALRPSLDGWVLWNDAVEHLAIGHVWASGAGFVDPVQFLPFFDTGAVLPAFAVRAPVLPALLGVAFAGGATAMTAVQLNAIWSCLVVGLLVLTSRRMMSLPAATAAGLWIGLMPAWLHLSRMPMTETTAVATFVAILATVSWASRSVAGAALCGILTVLAAATRANFAVLGGPIFLVLALPGSGRGLRGPSPWIYLATLGGGLLLLRGLAFVVTGWEPYSGYGLLATRLVDRIGTEGITDAVLQNARRLPEILAEGRYGWALWLAAPGVFWCLRGGLRASPERRLSALATLGFALLAIATLGRWDESRYPVPVVVPAVLCAAVLVDDLCALGARARPRYRRAWALAPALLLAPLVLGGRDPTRLLSLDPWFLQDHQSRPITPSEDERALLRLCRSIPPDALVVAQDPWSVYSWCGNAAVLIHKNLGNRPVRKRFFGQRGALYVVMRGFAPREWEFGSVRLHPIAGAKPFVLYTVLGGRREPLTWDSPGPLVCAGLRPGCVTPAAARPPKVRRERSGSPAKPSPGEARAGQS